MKKVFVSGCYDIVHAGHIQFFEEARALGDYLIVSFASEPVLWHHKQRKPSIPDEHKKVLLESLRMVDKVILGTGMKKGLDFEEEFLQEKPDVLAVTEDDLYSGIKKELCSRVGASYVVLPKTPPNFAPVSTTMLVNRIKAPSTVPLRVDFAGGWLDVPRYARKGSYVVNCAITPMVSLCEWPYEKRSGLGGSGAWAMLEGRDPVASELALGAGWPRRHCGNRAVRLAFRQFPRAGRQGHGRLPGRKNGHSVHGGGTRHSQNGGRTARLRAHLPILPHCPHRSAGTQHQYPGRRRGPVLQRSA